MRDPAGGAAVRNGPALARRQALLERRESVAVALAAAVGPSDARAVDVRVDREGGVARAHFERKRADDRARIGACIGAGVRRRRVASAARADEIAAALARRARAAAARGLTAGAAQRRRRAATVAQLGPFASDSDQRPASHAERGPRIRQRQPQDAEARIAAPNRVEKRLRASVHRGAPAQQAPCQRAAPVSTWRRSSTSVAPAPPSRGRADANAMTPPRAAAGLASHSQTRAATPAHPRRTRGRARGSRAGAGAARASAATKLSSVTQRFRAPAPVHDPAARRRRACRRAARAAA